MGPTILSVLVVAAVMYAVKGCPTLLNINDSCCEIKSNDDFRFSLSSASGVYNINNFCGHCKSVAEAYCDATSDRGGWLVIQRRKDGSVSFDRGWVEYEEGFGDLTGEFWYGLRSIHCLTSKGQWEVRIDLTHTNGSKTYLHYKKFSVGTPTDEYPLQITQYAGIYPYDPFNSHSLNAMKFTTKDQDNDRYRYNCAVNGNGKVSNGWWFNACAHITLNKQYSQKDKVYDGKLWHDYPFIEIKIKPITCK